MQFIIIGAIVILILLLASNIKIVPQTMTYIIERLGTYQTTWESGLHFKIPIFERVSRKVTLKEQVADFPPQPVITKDNVTMQIDTVVYFQILDPKLYTYGITNPMQAIENLTATTLRNIVGDLELDQTLTSRDIINTKMRSILDEATDPWGIKINRVELKNIMPPEAIRTSMEKQMKAERERRESILVAEGQKQSEILVAEGKKASVILEAEALKESKILEAEADKKAAILAAEASKEAQLLEAEGEANAIREVQQATADGIEMINKAKPSSEVLTIKGLEALAKIADGRATKMIIPSSMQSLAGLVSTVTDIAKTASSSCDKTEAYEKEVNTSEDGSTGISK